MLGIGQVGTPEVILILAVVVLLFGAKKLPDLARSIGKSARALKEGLKEGLDEEDEESSSSSSSS